MDRSIYSSLRRPASALLVACLVLGACATTPEPEPVLPPPPEPPPPPPSSVEVEALKRQPLPEPLSGGPELDERQGATEGGTRENGESKADDSGEQDDLTDAARTEAGVQRRSPGSPGTGVDSSGPSGVPAAAGAGSWPAKTEGEQLVTLESQLDQQLSEFDDALLRDREDLARSMERTHADGSDGGTGESQWEGDYDADGRSSQSAGTDQGSLEEGQTQGQRGGIARSSDRQDDITRSAELPDGGDDDIVARQLREAAERETDPELKEKLWQEYRDYKNSVSRKAGS